MVGDVRRLRRLLLCTVAAGSLAGAPALAAPQPTVSIPGEPLSQALKDLARQSGVNILFEPQATAGLRAEPIEGVMTAEDAARRLIADTDLEVVRDPTGSLIVRGAAHLAPKPLRQKIADVQPSVGPPASASVRVTVAAPEAIGLDEVVVTATRQTSTANRVSLSIAALTQRNLDLLGIESAQDLSRVVPGLSVPPTGMGGQTVGTSGVGIFTIRGVYASAGAATTGVYMDDTSLTRRNNAGVVQNNGAPLPILFDLQRVEVLKGPQGTLYGGSSQGGTVRFITPAPDLTDYSGLVRVEGTSLNLGGQGGEVGLAVGGPIVKDKLGFRLSALTRANPGYIDAYSPYTLQKLGSDVDRTGQEMVRGSVLWQVNERASVLATAYASRDSAHSQIVSPTTVLSKSANGQLASPSETFSTLQRCFDTSVFATFVAQQPALPMGTAPAASAVQPTEIPCSSANPAKFTRPALNYGPFPQGRQIAYLLNQQELTGRYTDLDVLSTTLNYDFDAMNVKSITSLVHDRTYAENAGGEDQTLYQYLTGGPTNPQTGAPIVGFPLWGAFPDYPGHFQSATTREGLEEELRLSSRGDGRPLSWVFGLFYSNQRINNHYQYPDSNIDQSLEGFWGLNAVQRFGVVPTDKNYATELNAHMNDEEMAAYGEASYYLTPKLKATVGLRFTRLNFRFDTYEAGYLGSRYPNSIGGSASGSTTNWPTTPKFGLTYELTANDLLYFDAATGFRSGGVNSPVGQTTCAAGLALYGIKATDAPITYGPDTVWNYELGGKFRLFDNRMQVNAALYRIDWSGIQSTLTLTCGQGFTENGGRARSEGVDLQGQYRPIQSLTFDVAAGYDDARYIDPVAGPRGPGIGPPAVNAGDPFPVPPWQLSLSGTWDKTFGAYNPYLRVDYQWQSGYTQPGSFGVASYSRYVLHVGANDVVNTRLGIRYRAWDFNVFANNLLDWSEKVGNAGIGVTQCSARDPSCALFGNFNPFVNQLYQRPREIGMQVNYRF
ncbi:MAG TPA: TonB-dependent receptor [Caulobacteraceae bacterium]|jgi:outer membrane receptor protein involved in Fe transport